MTTGKSYLRYGFIVAVLIALGLSIRVSYQRTLVLQERVGREISV